MEKFFNIDRRIIYVLLAVVVVIPLLKPMGLPFGVTAETQKAFNAVESLKPGDVVVMDFGYDADVYKRQVRIDCTRRLCSLLNPEISWVLTEDPLFLHRIVI